MGAHGPGKAPKQPGDRDPTSVLVALRRIVRFLRLADREAEAAHGLSAAQLFALHVLDETPAYSLADIASRTLTDQSSVSTVVAKLVERGLLSRKPGTDRRRVEIRITPAGRRVVSNSPVLVQSKIVAAVQEMPAAHRRELIRSLERLNTAIGASEVAPRMLFEDEPQLPKGKRRA